MVVMFLRAAWCWMEETVCPRSCDSVKNGSCKPEGHCAGSHILWPLPQSLNWQECPE